MHELLEIERHDGITHVRLNRPRKHNAMNDALMGELERFFLAPPEGTAVVVLSGKGANFSAGLDLAEQRHRDPFEAVRHSQWWQRIFRQIQFGGLPVVAAVHGAVIGGGLELAMCAHVRVAERSAFYQLPEGQRGIFVGGGASVRVARTIGAGRMTEMMLTGRRYDAEEGYRLGLSHYLAEPGEGVALALELARRIAGNAPLSNYAMVTGLARIEDMAADDGFYAESLLVALTQSGEEAARRMNHFLERKKAR